jgi:hypothetical protein
VFQLDDNGINLCECKAGHRFYFIYRPLRFERLLELALISYYDGFYTSAMMLLGSSLDTFNWFCLQCYSQSKGISLSVKDFENYRSEGILGAVKFLSSLNKEAFPNLKNDHPQFDNNGFVNTRNKAVHASYLPTEKEMNKHVQKSLEYIIKTTALMRQNYGYDVIVKVSQNSFDHQLSLRTETVNSELNQTIEFNLLGITDSVSLNNIDKIHQAAQNRKKTFWNM